MPDCSFFTTIVNELSIPLRLQSSSDTHGDWISSPASVIQPNACSHQFHLKDKLWAAGAEGTFKYAFDLPYYGGGTTYLDCSFACRYDSDKEPNYFTPTISHMSDFFSIYVKDFGTGSKPCTVTLFLRYKPKFNLGQNLKQLRLLHPVVPVSNSRNVAIGVSPSDGEVIWSPDLSGSLTDKSDSDVPGSFHCVTVGFDALDKAFSFTLSGLSSEHSKLNLRIEGKIGDKLVFQGTQRDPKDANVYTLSLTAKNSLEPFAWAGDVTWTITVLANGQIITLPTPTRVEIYAVSSDTSKAAFFKTSAVPIRLLRRIVYPATPNYIPYLVKHIFSDFGLQYESSSGGPSLASFNGGWYHLEDWIGYTTQRPPPHRVNCYDMSAIIQTCLPFLLGDLPRDMWQYIFPFGFIPKTLLVGWGQCNNPLFLNEDFPRDPVSYGPQTKLKRSHFGNHAFIKLPTGKIIDATCGPFDGAKTLTQYLEEARDLDPALYKATSTKYAAVEDVRSYPGVYSINGPVPNRPFIRNIPPSMFHDIEAMIRIAVPPNPPPIKRSNSPLLETPLEGKPLIRMNNASSFLRWEFTSDTITTARVEFIILSHHDEAIWAMENYLGDQTGPLKDLFKAPSAKQAHGQYVLVGTSTVNGIIWVHNNIFARVYTSHEPDKKDRPAAQLALDALADQIDKHIIDGTVEPGSWAMPKVPLISGIPGTVSRGKKFTVTATTNDPSLTQAFVTEGNVYLVERQSGAGWVKFTFLARSNGEDNIGFMFAHPHTFATEIRQYGITVN